jgi:hypothetical protein
VSLVLRKIGRLASRDRKPEIQRRFDEFVRHLELSLDSGCAVPIRPFSLDSLKSTKNGKSQSYNLNNFLQNKDTDYAS